MKHALSVYFANLFDLKGRSTRSEFWFVVVFYIAITLLVDIGFAYRLYSLPMVEIPHGFGTLYLRTLLFFFILVYVLCFTLVVRRLHDAGFSGWWILPLILYFIWDFAMTFWLNANDDLVQTTMITFWKSLLSFVISLYRIFIVVLLCLPSQPDNKYGEKSHYDALASVKGGKFKQLINDFLFNYFNFKGRTRRDAFWLESLLNSVFWLICFAISGFFIYTYFTSQQSMQMDRPGIDGIEVAQMYSPYAMLGGCFLILLLLTAIPQISLSIRRLHDVGKKATLYFVFLVLAIGLFLSILFGFKLVYEEEKQVYALFLLLWLLVEVILYIIMMVCWCKPSVAQANCYGEQPIEVYTTR